MRKQMCCERFAEDTVLRYSVPITVVWQYPRCCQTLDTKNGINGAKLLRKLQDIRFHYHSCSRVAEYLNIHGVPK